MLKTPIVKVFLRLLIVILNAVPFTIIFFVIPPDASMTIMIIFKTLVPLVLLQFTLFAFSNYFFVRFHLVNTAATGMLPIDIKIRLKQIRFDSDESPEKYH